MSRRPNPFLVLWTLAVAAATAAFVLFLAMRVCAIELGYDLGQAHAHVARLREVKRVLELELSSYRTPERVDFIARTLFGMSEPSPDRLVFAGAPPPMPADGLQPPTDGRAPQAAANRAPNGEAP